MGNLTAQKKERTEPTLEWTITVGGVAYACPDCSWKYFREAQNIRTARELFYKHVCADYPPLK
jgi:hypothetical protein